MPPVSAGSLLHVRCKRASRVFASVLLLPLLLPLPPLPPLRAAAMAVVVAEAAGTGVLVLLPIADGADAAGKAAGTQVLLLLLLLLLGLDWAVCATVELPEAGVSVDVWKVLCCCLTEADGVWHMKHRNRRGVPGSLVTV